MAGPLNPEQEALLKEKVFVHLATTNKDGSPQVSPLWVDYRDGEIIVNSEEHRLKVKNMKRDPRVSLSVQDPSKPYKYVQIKGRVTEITRTGGAEGIDALAKKYLNEEKYPWNEPADVRVAIRIKPEKVYQQG